MAKIKAPNSDYNGVSAGVAFINGEGETEIPHLIKWFREHGYTVDEGCPVLEAVPQKDLTVWQTDEGPVDTPEEPPKKPKRQTRKRGGKQ